MRSLAINLVTLIYRFYSLSVLTIQRNSSLLAEQGHTPNCIEVAVMITCAMQDLKTQEMKQQQTNETAAYHHEAIFDKDLWRYNLFSISSNTSTPVVLTRRRTGQPRSLNLMPVKTWENEFFRIDLMSRLNQNQRRPPQLQVDTWISVLYLMGMSKFHAWYWVHWREEESTISAHDRKFIHSSSRLLDWNNMQSKSA